MDKKELSKQIKEQAFALGFSACGISPIMDNRADLSNLKEWIDNHYHGDMEWIVKSIPLRENPAKLLSEVKSVVMLAYNYYTLEEFPNTHYKISRYALNQDYHWVLKNKTKHLIDQISGLETDLKWRVFVDSGPIFEKSYAVNAGLGWIGKNSCLIIPQKGSFFFLTALLLSVELEFDEPYAADHCGTCTQCIEACPTGAIVSPHTIDSNKCISYLTIEHKCETPKEIDFKATNQIFGCDLCQMVCPHNRFSTQTNESAFIADEKIRIMTNHDWESLSKSDFKKQFKNSPIQRAGYEKIKSNIAYIRDSDI